jgi:hypothetical protein
MELSFFKSRKDWSNSFSRMSSRRETEGGLIDVRDGGAFPGGEEKLGGGAIALGDGEAGEGHLEAARAGRGAFNFDFGLVEVEVEQGHANGVAADVGSEVVFHLVDGHAVGLLQGLPDRGAGEHVLQHVLQRQPPRAELIEVGGDGVADANFAAEFVDGGVEFGEPFVPREG